MNCTFCGLQCTFVGFPKAGYYYCIHHGNNAVKFLYSLVPGKNYFITFIKFIYNNNYYCARLFDDNITDKEKFRIDKLIFNPYSGMLNTSIPIISLNFKPKHITPENISDKLSKYLAFT